MPRLILASTSPYRREILARLGVPFEAVAPVCDETPLAGESAADTANRLAVLKAQSLVSRFPDALVIGSDQVALLDGQQLGKPHTVENAHAMLAAMRGRSVVFHTALCVLNAATGRQQTVVDTTTVTLRPYTDAQISRYLAQEPDALHCAGAAKSEGLGGALIARIDSSDPNALIGLPLFALITLLAQEGVEIL